MPMSPWQYKEYCEYWSELQNRAMESSMDTKASYDDEELSFIDVLIMLVVVLSGILSGILAYFYSI